MPSRARTQQDSQGHDRQRPICICDSFGEASSPLLPCKKQPTPRTLDKPFSQQLSVKMASSIRTDISSGFPGSGAA